MSMRKTVSWVVISFLIGVFSASLFSADIYVKSGSTGDGASKDSPMPHLWKAIDKAVRGDVIHVAVGVYNGKGGSGSFTIKVPDLTIVGGYNADFSSRSPFKNFTILERAKDYKGGAMGLGEGIIEGKSGSDHSRLIIDGLVLNGASRNSYHEDGKLNAKDSWNGALFKTNASDVKIKNCILLNPFGEGIASTWKGENNEISNCFIINTFYAAISTRSAQPDSVIRLVNNTIAFCWFMPSKGGGMCVFIGGKGKTILEKNVFAFAQTEDGEAGNAVNNTFGNEDTEMMGNVFFNCQGGYYKYMDADKKNLLAWKPEDMELINKSPEDFMLSKSGGNVEMDPQLVPDKDYFEKFSNFVASKPGKLNMDFMNQWRSSLGLPLQAEPGSPRKNWGMEYPLEKIIPNLVSRVDGKGVLTNIVFESYSSSSDGGGAGAATDEKSLNPADFKEVNLESFKKGSRDYKNFSGTPVSLKVGLGEKKQSFLLKDIGSDDYICVELIKAGASYPTRDLVFGYILKGSKVNQIYDKLSKKKNKVNKKGGVTVMGKATYIGNDTYPYPVAIVIDSIEE